MQLLAKLDFKQKDLLLLIVLLVPLYFIKIVGFYTYPDEFYYIFTGMQLAEGKGPTIQLVSPLLTVDFWTPTTTPNTYISVFPIGQSILVAIFYLIGGYYFIYYMNGIFSLLTVIIAYFFAFKISEDRSCSFISALLIGICPPVVFYSRSVLSDLPSMTFILFSFFLYVKVSKKNKYLFYTLSSLSLGFATLIRLQNILFLLPIILNQLRTKKLNELSTYLYYLPVFPFFCAIGLYNLYYFGNILTTGYHVYGIAFRFSFENFVLHLPRYFLILNLFPPLGLIATFLYLRKKIGEDIHFISFFTILVFLIFYSFFMTLPFHIEHLFIEGTRYMLVIIPYLCMNVVMWFRNLIKNKNLFYYLFTGVFLSLIIVNFVMISQYNAFKSRLMYYRDLFYTNTEPDSLIIGNDAWDKLFDPHSSLIHGERYYLKYSSLSEEEMTTEIIPFVESWMKNKSVYFIDDPYQEYAESAKHEFILQLLNERFHLHSIVATDSPYEVELFKVNHSNQCIY